MILGILITLIAAGYVFVAGMARGYIHNQPGHNQHKCDEWDDPPCFLGAAAWPVTLVAVVVVGVWRAGEKTEALRRSRRRQERDKKIAASEKVLYGRELR